MTKNKIRLKSGTAVPLFFHLLHISTLENLHCRTKYDDGCVFKCFCPFSPRQEPDRDIAAQTKMCEGWFRKKDVTFTFSFSIAK